MSKRKKRTNSNYFNNWSDQFGNQYSQGVRNYLDLASQYSYSPERYRLFVESTFKELW